MSEVGLSYPEIMHTTPDELHEPQAVGANAVAFQSTHWTVVLEAARQESSSGQAALAALYQTCYVC